MGGQVTREVNDTLGVAIIGCGLIGHKRARALAPGQLKICVDIDPNKAKALAAEADNCESNDKFMTALERPDVQIVVVATTNDSLSPIAQAAAQAGKHILVEKPAARNSREIVELMRVAKQNEVLVRVGFNHRYHPALIKAKEIHQSGALGELMMVRGRYGHGGRLGYESEWRADPVRSGGGELIDQGVHLIDLSRWFLGDIEQVQGRVESLYWDMPVEDNGFLILKSNHKQIAFLHVSCSEWKNLFSFEIYGRRGKLQIDGLGGSYGPERLTYYEMLPEMGPPKSSNWEFSAIDESWVLEFKEFIEDIRLARQPAANAYDALAALQVVEKIYRESGYDNRA